MAAVVAAGFGEPLVHKSCERLIEQLQSYAWDEKATARGEDKPVKQDDHSADAARYCLLTTRRVWRNLILPDEQPPNYQDTSTWRCDGVVFTARAERITVIR